MSASTRDVLLIEVAAILDVQFSGGVTDVTDVIRTIQEKIIHCSLLTFSQC